MRTLEAFSRTHRQDEVVASCEHYYPCTHCVCRVPFVWCALPSAVHAKFELQIQEIHDIRIALVICEWCVVLHQVLAQVEHRHLRAGLFRLRQCLSEDGCMYTLYAWRLHRLLFIIAALCSRLPMQPPENVPGKSGISDGNENVESDSFIHACRDLGGNSCMYEIAEW